MRPVYSYMYVGFVIERGKLCNRGDKYTLNLLRTLLMYLINVLQIHPATGQIELLYFDNDSLEKGAVKETFNILTFVLLYYQSTNICPIKVYKPISALRFRCLLRMQMMLSNFSQSTS